MKAFGVPFMKAFGVPFYLVKLGGSRKFAVECGWFSVVFQQNKTSRKLWLATGNFRSDCLCSSSKNESGNPSNLPRKKSPLFRKRSGEFHGSVRSTRGEVNPDRAVTPEINSFPCGLRSRPGSNRRRGRLPAPCGRRRGDRRCGIPTCIRRPFQRPAAFRRSSEA